MAQIITKKILLDTFCSLCMRIKKKKNNKKERRVEIRDLYVAQVNKKDTFEYL